MSFWLGFLLGMLVGGNLGFLTLAILRVADSDAEPQIHETDVDGLQAWVERSAGEAGVSIVLAPNGRQVGVMTLPMDLLAELEERAS